MAECTLSFSTLNTNGFTIFHESDETTSRSLVTVRARDTARHRHPKEAIIAWTISFILAWFANRR